MPARSIEDLCIQFSEQLRQTVLVLFFENVFLRNENLYLSPQILKNTFFKNWIGKSTFIYCDT